MTMQWLDGFGGADTAEADNNGTPNHLSCA